MLVVTAPPATVTQKTAETHFGIPESTFKAMSRDGLFPTKRIGRLLFAPYEAVRRALTNDVEQRTRFRRAIDKSDSNRKPIEIEEAVKYLASAPTPTEYRRRGDEIHAIAGDLSKRFEETREDGTPNPNYDKRLSEHARHLYYRVMVEDVRRRPPRRRKGSA